MKDDFEDRIVKLHGKAILIDVVVLDILVFFIIMATVIFRSWLLAGILTLDCTVVYVVYNQAMGSKWILKFIEHCMVDHDIGYDDSFVNRITSSSFMNAIGREHNSAKLIVGTLIGDNFPFKELDKIEGRYD
jgi:hypothetical protein